MRSPRRPDRGSLADRGLPGRWHEPDPHGQRAARGRPGRSAGLFRAGRTDRGARPALSGRHGTRKRKVAQIEVTVEAASDAAEDVAMADMVREWIARDELADETFDILDAIGKGISFTEIVWDISEGQYRPARLEWCDPRFFTFDRDGRTPLLRGGEGGNGVDEPLPPFKFIYHKVKAKSGLPVRSGIARAVTRAWMFKAFTQRDWAIFVQTYGQPVRLGRYNSSASAEDRATLWRAVANIAGDCAAIVPEDEHRVHRVQECRGWCRPVREPGGLARSPGVEGGDGPDRHHGWQERRPGRRWQQGPRGDR
ncbi:DUF935 family protein [Sphingomonas paucimobilis]|nr:DUF935 family protein [Sphingomonas paucimobilis]